MSADLPMFVDDLTQEDQIIYHLRFIEHRGLRGVAEGVGRSHEYVRQRLIKAIVPRLRHEDHEHLRDEEGIRLEELRTSAGACLTYAVASDNPELMLKAIRELHGISRTMIQLYGLERQVEDPMPSEDKINSLLDVFVAGAVASGDD